MRSLAVLAALEQKNHSVTLVAIGNGTGFAED